jgi:hypothetical protein
LISGKPYLFPEGGSSELENASVDRGKSCLHRVDSQHDSGAENHRQKSLSLIWGSFAFFLYPFSGIAVALSLFCFPAPSLALASIEDGKGKTNFTTPKNRPEFDSRASPVIS